MHESSIMRGIFEQIDETLRRNKASRVSRVCIRLGVLSQISPDHLKEHFYMAAEGTPASDAEVRVESITDMEDPDVQSIVLESIEIEE